MRPVAKMVIWTNIIFKKLKKHGGNKCDGVEFVLPSFAYFNNKNLFYNVTEKLAGGFPVLSPGIDQNVCIYSGGRYKWYCVCHSNMYSMSFNVEQS